MNPDPALIIVPGPTGVHLVTPAMLIPDDREVAWAGAKSHMRTAPDRAFVMGRYVHAGKPPNENGHLFRLEDLETAHKLLPNTPLNILHQAQHIVGAFIASELMYPTAPNATASASQGTVLHHRADGATLGLAKSLVGHGGGADAASRMTSLAADLYSTSPWVESLAVVWKYYFPEEFDALKRAHDQGMSFFSMECRPQSVSCPECAHETVWDGMSSESYCEHMNATRAKWLEKPLFTAGALVLPPALPGWKEANITEIAGLLEAKPEEAEFVYNQVAAVAQHLEPAEAEVLMAMLLAGAFDERPERAVIVAPLWDRLSEGADIDLVPPADVQANARTALAWIAEHGAHGIEPMAIARARGLAEGLPRPPATIAVMAAYHDQTPAPSTLEALSDEAFVRHVEYALWGAVEGRDWVAEKSAEIDAFMLFKKKGKPGEALRNGSYRISDAKTLKEALKLFPKGEGKFGITREMIKAHIMKRARALKLMDLLPPAWSAKADADAEARDAKHNVDRSGVIAAHTPPADIVEALAAIPGVTEPTELLHLAVTYVDPHPDGHSITDGDHKATMAKVSKAMADFARTAEPFKATVDGLGRFELSGGVICTYATVEAPALAPLRDALREALLADDIPIADQRGWTPRIVLAYHGQEDGPEKVPTDLSWTVDSIALWWGDERVSFDLKVRS